MAKVLLYLDENLASSIALRYVDYLSSFLELNTFILHVVYSDGKKLTRSNMDEQASIEKMLRDGEATISRLLKTEKVKFGFSGPPKIRIGNRENEILRELREGNYDLFIEGHLPISKTENLTEVVSSELYEKCPCSILYVKNLSVSRTIGILIGDGTEPDAIAHTLGKLLKDSEMDIDLIYYNFKDVDNLEFLDSTQSEPSIETGEQIFTRHGLKISNIHNVLGTPEAMSDFLMNYAFVASSFSPRMPLIYETLAQTQASVLLCKK